MRCASATTRGQVAEFPFWGEAHPEIPRQTIPGDAGPPASLAETMAAKIGMEGAELAKGLYQALPADPAKAPEPLRPLAEATIFAIIIKAGYNYKYFTI